MIHCERNAQDTSVMAEMNKQHRTRYILLVVGISLLCVGLVLYFTQFS